jgi:Icc-related predicted phosphoesterase
MSEILLIGDVHGKWEQYADLLKKYSPDRSIQIGDLGWGFAGQDTEFMQRRVKALENALSNYGAGDNRYIRGNHDNPAACKAHKFCIDDATYEPDTDIFLMGGAFSIDRNIRTEGYDWWADEELSYSDLYTAVDTYEATKPRIVITHDCPKDAIGNMFPWYLKVLPNRTCQALNSMFAIHQPNVHIFGHWHHHVDMVINGTRFICLAELQTLTIDINTLDINY